MAEHREIRIPDLGGEVDSVTVAEVLVAPGDQIAVDDPVLTLESDKASMDVPSPAAGKVVDIRVKADDEVKEGDVFLLLEVDEAAGGEESAGGSETANETDGSGETAPTAGQPPAEQEPAEQTPATPEPTAADSPPTPGPPQPTAKIDQAGFDAAYASPAVRRLARELAIDLGRVTGSGRGGRITRDDLHGFIQSAMAGGGSGSAGGAIGGFEWPQIPDIDFAKFGEVDIQPLSRIRKVSARNLHRSWLHVPHVTQHELADITEMEAFRKAHGDEAKQKGYKLTPVAFLLKAAAAALKEFPNVNASLDPGGANLIVKKYVHIGVAVDTPNGLVVPVLRDVDQKSLSQLGRELGEISARARDGKLTPKDFQGGTFTISSLGGIGGTAFTPIVNAPEVAILGVSRSRMEPVWQGGEFVPRLMLPLSFSYDHRVIDGATAARFVVVLARLLGDIRRLLL